MTTETRFPILIPGIDPSVPPSGRDPITGAWVDEDEEGVLSVKVTDEGIICDVENAEGEVIASWCCMAQDMADEYCH